MTNRSNKSLGQYFTPDIIVDFMINLISSSNPKRKILEPSAGEGVFLQHLNKFPCELVSIEIDTTLANKSDSPILYMDFFDYSIENKFDVVIGNPPYIRWKNQSLDARKTLLERTFWGKRMNGLTDLLQPFIFKSIDHLHTNGELIFITPKFWLQTLHSRPLREYIKEHGHITVIVDFNEKNIFTHASLNIIIFKFVKRTDLLLTKYVKFKSKSKIEKLELDLVAQALNELETTPLYNIIDNPIFTAYNTETPHNDAKWYFLPKKDQLIIEQLEYSCTYSPVFPLDATKAIKLTDLMTKEDRDNLNQDKTLTKKIFFHNKSYYQLLQKPTLDYFLHSQKTLIQDVFRYVRLGDIVDIGNGMVSGLDKAFRLDSTEGLTDIEKNFLIKVIKSREISQFKYKKYDWYFFIPEVVISSEKDLKDTCKILYNVLLPYKDDLKNRWSPHSINWWEWAFPRNKTLLERSTIKIFVPCKDRFDKRNHVRFCIVYGDFYANQDITAMVKCPWVKESEEYITAFLNSTFVFKWLLIKGLIRGGVLEFSEKPLSEIPFRLINWNNPEEVKIHQDITTYVKDIIMATITRADGIIKCESLFRELFSKAS